MSFLYAFKDSLLNVLFPNRCKFCDRVLEEGCCICLNCLGQLEFIGQEFCEICGAPKFDKLQGVQGSCEQCKGFEFHFHRNESLGMFSGKLRELIHEYKFGKRRSLSRTFSQLLMGNKSSYIEEHEILIPVPLSRSRLKERGFNQSQLIVEELKRMAKNLLMKPFLVRRGNAPPQSSVSNMDERIKNVTDVFLLDEKFKHFIAGKNVLLFDDVLTTGATASACALALYGGGAENVDLLTLARALKISSF